MNFYMGPDGRVRTAAMAELLTAAEMLAFLNRGARRKARLAVPACALFPTLSGGSVSCRLAASFPTKAQFFVRVEASTEVDGFRITCEGDLDGDALDRINRFIGRTTAIRKKKAPPRRMLARKAKKPKAKTRAERKPRKMPPRAALTMPRNEMPKSVVRQFKGSRITWHEAVDSVVAMRRFKDLNHKQARALVDRQLRRSMRVDGRNGKLKLGTGFALFKQGGFTIRFDIAEGAFKGDLTPMTIACTKDNRDPRYRRLRDHFMQLLTGRSSRERKLRAAVLWPVPSQAALAVAA